MKNIFKTLSFNSNLLSRGKKQNTYMSTEKTFKIVWKRTSSLQFDMEMKSHAGRLHWYGSHQYQHE